ncbi:putative zinc finger protein [Diplonema papillatum]|nr:putative zinc finger protein [Diplonema papillatum]
MALLYVFSERDRAAGKTDSIASMRRRPSHVAAAVREKRTVPRPSLKLDTLACAACAKTGREVSLVSCSCRLVLYCGTPCQEADWAEHKKKCTRVPVCQGCGITWYDVNLMQCTCRKAVYCGTKCQSDRWKEHSAVCSVAADSQASLRNRSRTASQEVHQLLRPQVNDNGAGATQQEDATAMRKELANLVPWLMADKSDDGPLDNRFETESVASGSTVNADGPRLSANSSSINSPQVLP